MQPNIELRPLQINEEKNGQAYISNGPPTNGLPYMPSSQGKMYGRLRASRFGPSYQLSRNEKVMIAVFSLFNTALLLVALGTLFAGFLLVTYRGQYANLCTDNEWYAAAFCVLVVGFMIVGLAIFCYIIVYQRSSILLKIYLGMVLVLFLGEATAGIYAFARRGYIEHRFQVCMKNAYIKQYADPAFKKVTAAWDLFQNRFDCCGVDDPYDYRSNTKIGDEGPKSCGGSRADARARQPCFQVIKREVFDNYHIIGGAAVGLAGIQLVTLILGVFVVWIFYTVEENE